MNATGPGVDPATKGRQVVAHTGEFGGRGGYATPVHASWLEHAHYLARHLPPTADTLQAA